MCEKLKVTCIICGEEFEMTDADVDYYITKFGAIPKRCLACRSKKRRIHTMICVDCGRAFQLNDEQIQKMTDRGLQVPKRCPSCRTRKRAMFEQFKDLESRR